jgi:hypothetical protein
MKQVLTQIWKTTPTRRRVPDADSAPYLAMEVDGANHPASRSGHQCVRLDRNRSRRSDASTRMTIHFVYPRGSLAVAVEVTFVQPFVYPRRDLARAVEQVCCRFPSPACASSRSPRPAVTAPGASIPCLQAGQLTLATAPGETRLSSCRPVYYRRATSRWRGTAVPASRKGIPARDRNRDR